MKMNKRTYTFKEPFTVTSEYTRGTGHNLYGKVVISVTPAPSLSFKSEATWPHENYEGAIRKGVLEVLENAGVGEGMEAEFILREVGWRDTESHWDSYYEAAKMAAEEILQKMEVVAEKGSAD